MTVLSIYDDEFKQIIKPGGIQSVMITNDMTIADPLEPDGKKRFILVSKLIPLLQRFLIEPGYSFLPILFVHCRRDPGLPCVMPTGKYTIKHLTPKTNPTYLLIEAHGRYREDPLVLLKDQFEDDGLHEHLQKNVFYRSPIGSRCRQLEYHQIYDNDIRCRIDGDTNRELSITDDALMIQGMRISIRHMTDACDYQYQRQGTLCNQFTSPLRRSLSLPQRGSIPYGASPLGSKSSRSIRTPRRSRWLNSQTKTKRKLKERVSRIQEEPEPFHGGTLKKRRRKTRKR